MEGYFDVAKLLVGTGLAFQLCLLGVQIWGFSKHRRLHFALLVAGALTGLTYAAATASPLLFPMGMPARIFVAQISLALLVVAGGLGVSGMILLIRAYHQLAGGTRA